jgi:ligand-binding sensor domain-containing protein
MKSRLVLLFLFLTLNFSLFFSIFSSDIKIHRVLNTEKVNLCVAQDKDGLLWIGTEGGGLFCYDGNEIKKVKISEDEKLFEMIPSVFIDRDGIIWVFIQGQGLFSCDKNSGLWKRYKSEIGNSNSLTSDKAYWSASLIIITEDKEGLIWIGTADGLNCYDKKTGKFTQYRHVPGNINSLSNNCVSAVFIDKEGLVWIGTENGLNSYNKMTNSFSCYRHDSNNISSPSDNFIKTIKEDKGGNLWIGTKNTGIDKFDKKNGIFTNYRHNPNGVSHIMIDRLNNVWICSEGGTGIDKYDTEKNTFRNYSYNPQNPNSISSNEVLCSFEDNSGIIR